MQMNVVSPSSPTWMESYVKTQGWIRCYRNIKNVGMASSALEVPAVQDSKPFPLCRES